MAINCQRIQKKEEPFKDAIPRKQANSEPRILKLAAGLRAAMVWLKHTSYITQMPNLCFQAICSSFRFWRETVMQEIL